MKKDKSERNRKIMVAFMGIIMIGSIFGVIFFGFYSGGITSSLRYNGFKFIQKGNVWTTDVGGREAVFTYYPEQIGLIEVEPKIIEILKNKIEIDATADANGTFIQGIALAQFQMRSTLGNFNIFIRDGFTTENEFNLPVIRCEDSTQFIPVIYFRRGNITRIYSNESCIIVEADNNADFVRAKDRIVYGMLSIIN